VPISLRVIIGIVLLEAVAIWGLIAYLVVEEPGELRVTGYIAMYAVALTFLAIGLLRRRRWARAPLIVLQLLLSVVGASLVAAGAPVLGAILVVVPVACVGLLLTSSTRIALTPRRDQ